MGMFGFFKKKELVEEKVVVESFEDAVGIFDERVVVLDKRGEEVLVDAVGRLDGFYVSVEEKLGVLGGVDIEGKKEHERAKILVRQGLDKYIGLVRGLLKELRNLEKDDLGKFARDVGRVFVGFEKGSTKVYERATYLVGDEMMAVRNEIRRFYNGLLKMFDGEKGLLDGLVRVGDVRLKLDEVGRLKEKVVELEGEVSAGEGEVVRLRERVVGLRDEVEGIKKSDEYVAGLKLREEVGVLSGRIDGEVLKLKGLIDFKKLIGIVHGNARELEIVKGYRDSFVSEFARDGERLVGILEGSNMKSAEIVSKIGLISGLDKDLIEMRKRVGVDVCVGKLELVGKIEGEIEVKMVEGVKVRSRLKEVGVRFEELRDEIVGLVGGLG